MEGRMSDNSVTIQFDKDWSVEIESEYIDQSLKGKKAIVDGKHYTIIGFISGAESRYILDCSAPNCDQICDFKSNRHTLIAIPFRKKFADLIPGMMKKRMKLLK
jgi:hypothetical protein